MSSWSDFTASNTSKWKHDVTMSALRTHRSHVGDRDTPTLEIDTPYVLPQPAVSHQPANRRSNWTPANLIRLGWGGLKKHLGSGNMLSSATSSTAATIANSSPSGKPPHALELYPPAAIEDTLHDRDRKPSREVDLVVVDRDWSAPNDPLHDANPSGAKSLDGMSISGAGSLASGAASITSNSPHPRDDDTTLWAKHRILSFMRWDLYPLAQDFFSSTYQDKATEAVYAREQWAMQKSLASWSCIFMIVNWILGCAFIPKPVTHADAIFYYGVATVLTFPLIIMVALNFPLTKPNFYQAFVCISVWSWSFYQIAFMFSCDFYRAPYSSCGSKDFYATFYYTSALQTVALFGLQMKRISALIGAAAFFIMSSILILPLMSSWTRNSVNFMFYQGFLIYMHYQREKAARRMFTLRDALENQFHVRVPLNTALLAVQNMAAGKKAGWEATAAVLRDQEIEFMALEGSLSMMSKVLNDILDFNRMDSGRFESLSRPYTFHSVMESIFVPLRLATDARNLTLVTELDPRIDQIARKAAYAALGEAPGTVDLLLEQNPDELGIVAGDETRLRQIITNLASNACKFTSAGGVITVKTQLILPTEADQTIKSSIRTAKAYHSSNNNSNTPSLYEYSKTRSPTEAATLKLGHSPVSSQETKVATDVPPDRIVVRIEITDTGSGIREKDIVNSKLFSAFNQTEQGKLQGGKGTGLGLALVRQIVQNSGGRLGVKSKTGEGSTFWVELPLEVGKKVIDAQGPPPMPVVKDEPASAVWPPEEILGRDGRRPELSLMGSTMSIPSLQEMSKAYCSSPLSTSGAPGLNHDEVLMTIPSSSQEKNTSTEPTILTITRPSTPVEDTSPPSPEVITMARRSPKRRPGHIAIPAPALLGDKANPIIPNGTASSSVSGSANTTPKTFDLNVLVVDDDPLTRLLMSRLLSRLGCTVSTAENGRAALEMMGCVRVKPSIGHRPSHSISMSAESGESGVSELGDFVVPRESDGQVERGSERRFAICFMDNQMPIMSGQQAIAKLRELGRDDFVVGVTGNALLTDQQEYLDAGVDQVLTKPVMECSLREALVVADERKKAAAALLSPSTALDNSHRP